MFVSEKTAPGRTSNVRSKAWSSVDALAAAAAMVRMAVSRMRLNIVRCTARTAAGCSYNLLRETRRRLGALVCPPRRDRRDVAGTNVRPDSAAGKRVGGVLLRRTRAAI